jgi:pimeloyl-ACP methyl ester carboxylesterase
MKTSMGIDRVYHRVRHRLAVMLLGVVVALPAGVPASGHADEPKKDKAAAPGLEGIWQGSLKVGGLELRLVFKVTRKPDGVLSAKMDSLDQGARDVPLDEATFKDQVVRMKSKSMLAEFTGKMSSDGSQIVGDWKQAFNSFPLTLKRLAKEPRLNRPQEPKPPYPYTEEEVAYDNPKAGIKLAGTLTLPPGKGPFPAVLLITGSGPQDRDEALFGHKPFKVIADYLTRRGIAVLRVDDRGVAKSTGSHSKATTLDFADDVETGVAFLKSRPDINPTQIGLIGHSEGGIIAPIVAARSSDVAFIVLMAGTGVNLEQVLYLQGQAILKASGVSAGTLKRQREMQEILFAVVKEEPDDSKALAKLRERMKDIKAKLSEGERKELDKQQGRLESQLKSLTSPWFRFALTYDPRPTLQKVMCPVLALNGDKDLQVDSKVNLVAIEKALQASGNKDYTIKELPRLNHLFQTSKTGSVTEYGSIEETIASVALEAMASWIAERTLAVTAKLGRPATDSVVEGVVVVAPEVNGPILCRGRGWLRGRRTGCWRR